MNALPMSAATSPAENGPRPAQFPLGLARELRDEIEPA